MLSVFIGIDPGKKGGIGVIDETGARLMSCVMPVKDGEIDVAKLRSALRFATDHAVQGLVVLEKAQAMPKQGVVGVFNYGVGYGRIKAVLDLLELPYIEPRPAAWKKVLKLLKTTKLASCKLAEELFAFEYKGPRGGLKDGEAEALLLAEYGRRKSQ